MASFSTVSLVKETPDVIHRFAEWYRAAGASEVLIYHDGPAAQMELGSGVTQIECDEAFWNDLCGGRPPVLEDRQSAVFAAGLERCGSDWLLVVDADEFVFGNRAIPDFLDNVPGTVDAVSVPTAEAVWGPGDALGEPFGSTHFRHGLAARMDLAAAQSGDLRGRGAAPAARSNRSYERQGVPSRRPPVFPHQESQRASRRTADHPARGRRASGFARDVPRSL